MAIWTRGNIELYYATITGNNFNYVSSNGAVFATPGTTSKSAKVYCSTFANNKGYGLDAWGFENSLTFVGPSDFSGNPSGDYLFNGTATFEDEDPNYPCNIPVLGCTDPAADNYDPQADTDDGSCIYLGCTDPTAFNYDPSANTDDGSCIPVIYGCTDPTATNFDSLANTNDGSCEYPPVDGVVGGSGGLRGDRNTSTTISASIIPVTGGQLVAISCVNPITVLQLLNGDFVTFANLCHYEAMLDTVPEDELPSALPDGDQYASGLNVTLMLDGSTVDELPSGTSMTVSFVISAGMEGETFAILRWDGNSWVEESVSVENGYVKAVSSNTGTFALVVK